MRRPGPQQIRNSNSYGLEALVERAGGRRVRQPNRADRREELDAERFGERGWRI